MSTMAIDLAEYGSSEALVASMCRRERTSCRCQACVALCERQPCIGTPQDIARLIEAGHGEWMFPTLWLVGVVFGLPPVEMVQLRQGRCPMLRDGLCSLHDAGLKPTEGALATHEGSRCFSELPTTAVAITWLLPVNRALVRQLIDWAQKAA